MGYEKTEKIVNVAISKIDRALEKYPSSFPYYSKNGKWVTVSETTADDWVSGFWAGILWIAFILTSEEKYLSHALNLIEKLESKFSEVSDTNLGYLYGPSCVLGYKITKDKGLKTLALNAADRLLERFDQKSGFFYVDFSSWAKEKFKHFGTSGLLHWSKKFAGRQIGVTAIDPLPSLSLLWWAYSETNKKKYYRVAYRHALAASHSFIRKDGSTFHLVFFDLDTGEILHNGTIQGFKDSSCWSRGQSWGICGFALAYEFSREPLFSASFEKLSSNFIKNLNEDGSVYYDFTDSMIPHVPLDTSASVIACSGWMRYINIEDTPESRDYGELSGKVLLSLSKNYLRAIDEDGILAHGCYHKKAGLGVGESLIWGDYFYLEKFIKPEHRIF
jgi:unsaturated chondroitin disaccharide hydrolase